MKRRDAGIVVKITDGDLKHIHLPWVDARIIEDLTSEELR